MKSSIDLISPLLNDLIIPEWRWLWLISLGFFGIDVKASLT